MVLVLFTETLPKATGLGVNARIGKPTPTPVSVMSFGDPEALEAIEREPGEVPGVVGAKITLIVALAPAAIVVGMPVMLKGPPLGLAVIALTLSAALPVLLNVRGTCTLPVMLTLPKSMVEAENLVEVLVTTKVGKTPPTPVIVIVVGEPAALWVMVRVPLAVPPAVGVKVRVTIALPPAGIVNGNACEAVKVKGPLAGETEIALTVSAAVPVLLTVS